MTGIELPIRGQCRRSTPSLVLPDGTEWTSLGEDYHYGLHLETPGLNPLVVRRVDRSTQWGNPWEVTPVEDDLSWAVTYRTTVQPDRYETEAEATHEVVDRFTRSMRLLNAIGLMDIDLAPLLNADVLSCWCPIGAPCHADVLCELVGQLKARTL